MGKNLEKALPDGTRDMNVKAAIAHAMDQPVYVKQAGGMGIARVEFPCIHIQCRPFAQDVSGSNTRNAQYTTAVTLIRYRRSLLGNGIEYGGFQVTALSFHDQPTVWTDPDHHGVPRRHDSACLACWFNPDSLFDGGSGGLCLIVPGGDLNDTQTHTLVDGHPRTAILHRAKIAGLVYLL
jgi:hypothetical protein